jgi:ribulose-phosphate 3-epimerase
LNPATSFDDVQPFLGAIDLLLVMTVVPGFGGQPFMPETMAKVRRAADERSRRGFNFRVEVDGGINSATAAEALQHGADTLVAGTSVFGAPDIAVAIRELRKRG